MKYLLDTHLLLWAIAGDRRLPARLRTLLAGQHLGLDDSKPEIR